MKKFILFLLLPLFAIGQETSPKPLAEVEIIRQWNARRDIDAIPGTSYSWRMPDDTARYFKYMGDGDQTVATIYFTNYVEPFRLYDDVDANVIYLLANGQVAPNMGTNIYTAVGWSHYNGGVAPFPAWTQGFTQKTCSYSQVRDQRIQFTFTGKRIRVFGEISNNKGIAGFKIGNSPEILRDLYAETTVNNSQLIFTSDVTQGTHMLTIRVTGNKNTASVSSIILIDRIEVDY